ncbi:MAG TPA: CBS domain-containing protein [Polyangiaceae bacterium]|jgi:CBS domain-containing protein
MKAETLMTSPVCTCSEDDSLEQAARIMWESDVGCVVVIDEQEHPVGMLTDRDALMAAYTQGVPLRAARVSSAMSREPLKCSSDMHLKEIEQAMQSAQIRRVPVVNSDGKLVGIVGLGDIARSSQDLPLHVTEVPGVAKTLACVTQPRSREVAAAE